MGAVSNGTGGAGWGATTALAATGAGSCLLTYS